MLTDLDGFRSLQPAIVSLQINTLGPVRVGTAWVVTRKLLDKETSTRLYISELESPSTLVIEGEGDGVTYKTRYDLIETDAGTTIAMELEGTTDSFVASLMDKMTSSSLKDSLADDLARLKEAAENSLAAKQT